MSDDKMRIDLAPGLWLVNVDPVRGRAQYAEVAGEALLNDLAPGEAWRYFVEPALVHLRQMAREPE